MLKAISQFTFVLRYVPPPELFAMLLTMVLFCTMLLNVPAPMPAVFTTMETTESKVAPVPV